MTKKELKARCKELGIPTEGLTTNALLEEAIAKREAQLEAEKNTSPAEQSKEKTDETEKETSGSGDEAGEPETKSQESEETGDKVKEGTASSQEEEPSKGGSLEEEEEEEESEEAPEPKRLVHEDKQGRKWAFKDRAPKTLNIDGHPMSQEEIFDNEDVISELVYGNCSFLTQIHE